MPNDKPAAESNWMSVAGGGRKQAVYWPGISGGICAGPGELLAAEEASKSRRIFESEAQSEKNRRERDALITL